MLNVFTIHLVYVKSYITYYHSFSYVETFLQNTFHFSSSYGVTVQKWPIGNQSGCC